MTLRSSQTRLSLIASLVVGSCSFQVGDFCDVVEGPLEFERGTAASIVRTDRRTAERIDAQNSYGRDHCPGPGWRPVS